MKVAEGHTLCIYTRPTFGEVDMSHSLFSYGMYDQSFEK